MKRVLATLPLLALVIFPVLGQDAKDAIKKDLEAMQGKWKVVEMIEDGDKLSDDDIKVLEVTVQGDILTVREKKEEVAQFKMKIDPSKTPKAAEMIHTKGDEKGQNEPSIYEITGDSFKVCMNEEGKNRPKAFESKDGSGFTLIVMKRAGKK